MSKLNRLLIILIILASLLPAWYIHQWLQKVIQPRRSFGQFMLYLFCSFALVFAYTFLVVLMVAKLFPPAK